MRDALILLLAGCTSQGGAPPLICAAASTEEAVSAIAPSATVHAAATSMLARQIAAGAPCDVFVSADAAWVDWLDDKHLVMARAEIASNGLVHLGRLDYERLAVADPEHVPAGRYTKATLRALGEWKPERVLPTANVRAALALLERGEADAAIVYATDAALSNHAVVRRLEPPQPIRYVAARLTDGGGSTYERIRSGDFTKYGFRPVRERR